MRCTECMGMSWRRPVGKPCACGESHAPEIVLVPSGLRSPAGAMSAPDQCARCRTHASDEWRYVGGSALCLRCARDVVRKCATCGEVHAIHHGDVCRGCSANHPGGNRDGHCKACGKVCMNSASGLCRPCYLASRRPKARVCEGCGKQLSASHVLNARARCVECYRASRRRVA